MGKRCVVPECTSSSEENEFKRNLKQTGESLCPIHKTRSEECKCSKAGRKRVYSQYSFPTCPTQRSVWLALLRLPTDFQPTSSNSVCSKHFDVVGGRGQKFKVPTVNIGLSTQEVNDILNEYVGLVSGIQAMKAIIRRAENIQPVPEEEPVSPEQDSFDDQEYSGMSKQNYFSQLNFLRMCSVKKILRPRENNALIILLVISSGDFD